MPQAKREGNVAEAARRLGINRKTAKESYDAAMARVGSKASTRHVVTQRLKHDRRGQADVAEGDDRRR